MPTFSSIVAGPRARKRVTLPLPGSRFDVDAGKWEGPTIDVDMRPLRADEYDAALAGARDYAVSRGLAEPTDGDDLFDRGKMAHTLALACVDVDSPLDSPRPFFDGGVEQILTSEALTPEVLAYLYEQQQLVQDDASPLRKNLSPAEFTTAVLATAAGDMSFFVCMRPGTQWSFTRSLASLLAESMRHGLPSSSASSTEPQPSPTGT